MTAAEIARRCGVHISQVYRWELGKSVPHGPALGCLLMLAEGGIKPEDLKRSKRRRNARKRSAA